MAVVVFYFCWIVLNWVCLGWNLVKVFFFYHAAKEGIHFFRCWMYHHVADYKALNVWWLCTCWAILQNLMTFHDIFCHIGYSNMINLKCHYSVVRRLSTVLTKLLYSPKGVTSPPKIMGHHSPVYHCTVFWCTSEYSCRVKYFLDIFSSDNTEDCNGLDRHRQSSYTHKLKF